MTANQIAYFKARTEKEHYERADKETKRHNVTDEAIRSESNAITSWFNQKQNEHLIRSDAINMAHFERMDAETYRHNRVSETQADIANNINYLNALSKKEEAQAATKRAEAEERKTDIAAFLSLDPFGKDAASANYANVQAYYVPKYFKLTEAMNMADVKLKGAQTAKTYSSSVTDVFKTLVPFGLLLSGG